MNFNRKNPPRTRKDLDEFVRIHGLRPYGVIRYKDRDIFIAETDLENDRPMECPWGYFQTVWFTTRPNNEDLIDVGRPIDFEAMHDKEEGWTSETKRIARIQTALNDAMKFIDQSIQTGRLEH